MTFTVPKTYDPGDMISLNALFYKEDGTLGDPSSVVLKVRDPLGVQTNESPTRLSTGSYKFDYQTAIGDPEGRYVYRFEGAGTITSAEEKSFFLNPTDFDETMSLHMSLQAPPVLDIMKEESEIVVVDEPLTVNREDRG